MNSTDKALLALLAAAVSSDDFSLCAPAASGGKGPCRPIDGKSPYHPSEGQSPCRPYEGQCHLPEEMNRAHQPDGTENGRLFEGVDWNHLFRQSRHQGVGAVAADGLQRLVEMYPDTDFHFPEDRVSVTQRHKWLGQSVAFERKYGEYEKALSELSSLYASEGISMMVLKGYGLSLNYPIPSHRPGGDIDIYLFGKFREADRFVQERLSVKVDRSHHHHTLFRYGGITVENHFDFINVHAHRDAPAIEAKLKELSFKANAPVLLPGGESIFLPSADFNCIFLLRHMGQHFAGERVNLRQLLDWGFFMKKHSASVDWASVTPFLQRTGLWTFFGLANSLCVKYLGFSQDCFPELSDDESLVRRILEDVLSPEFSETEPSTRLGRGLFRARRWWANRWKHRMVYSDSLLVTALTLAWSHIRKPDTVSKSVSEEGQF